MAFGEKKGKRNKILIKECIDAKRTAKSYEKRESLG
jgi:hypothetical protein